MRETRYGSSPYVSSVRPQRGSRAIADHEPHGRDELGLPGGGEADGLWKLGGIARTQAGTALLVHDGGDAETRCLHQETLDGVHEGGALARPQPARTTDARDVPRAVAQQLARLRFGEGLGLDEPGRPHAAELRQLLVERHARQEVVHARIEATRGVPIGGVRGRRLRRAARRPGHRAPPS
jgi:hypothetical protein